MFQPVYKCFRKFGNSKRISVWKSKGLLEESIKPHAISNNSLVPALNYIKAKIWAKFDGSCLKQDKLTFNHKTVSNTYILYKINLWSFKQNADFMLGNYFCGAGKLTKMLILINIVILDVILDLMHMQVFRYVMVVVLVKT